MYSVRQKEKMGAMIYAWHCIGIRFWFWFCLEIRIEMGIGVRLGFWLRFGFGFRLGFALKYEAFFELPLIGLYLPPRRLERVYSNSRATLGSLMREFAVR